MTHYLQTHDGGTYDLEDPNPTSISLLWMIPALAQICRYTGHPRRHYSVAQHCVIGARVLRDMGADSALQRYMLLHDAHESVTGDVASPIKRVLGASWAAFEGLHRLAFCSRFGIAREIPSAVRDCDLRMLITERDQCLAALRKGERADGWPDARPYEQVRIFAWDPPTAEREYAHECQRLGVI